jgi:hypothetical protein
MTRRESAINRLERDWEDFLKCFEGLTDSMLGESGVVGYWSIRDVMAHMTTWEEEALKALPLILEGRPLPRYTRYGGIDAFNAREQERKRSLSLERVKHDLGATHQRLAEFLASAPESAYASGGRFRHRLRLDTYHHYREHTLQIFAWREKQKL